jgi:hypothetical protein
MWPRPTAPGQTPGPILLRPSAYETHNGHFIDQCCDREIAMAWTFVTTTTYGTWLPGDLRGYVEGGEILPGNPRLMRYARTQLSGEPVLLDIEQQDALFVAIGVACDEFNYRLTDVSIESWHLHWIVGHDDGVPVMAGRLKNRMRQSLAMGRVWTAGYWDGDLSVDEAMHCARRYIARHGGCRMTAGRPVNRPPAGGRG